MLPHTQATLLMVWEDVAAIRREERADVDDRLTQTDHCTGEQVSLQPASPLKEDMLNQIKGRPCDLLRHLAGCY